MWRKAAWCVLCACVASAAARPAPPARKTDNNESKMLPDESIKIQRLPNAYLIPFSLWPVPRHEYWPPDPIPRARGNHVKSLGKFKNLRFGFNRR